MVIFYQVVLSICLQQRHGHTQKPSDRLFENIMWERNCTWIPLTIHPCWNFWKGYGGFHVTLKEEDTLLLMVQCFNWSVLTATQTVTHTHYWINSPTLSTHGMCNYNAKRLETWNISFHSQWARLTLLPPMYAAYVTNTNNYRTTRNFCSVQQKFLIWIKHLHNIPWSLLSKFCWNPVLLKNWNQLQACCYELQAQQRVYTLMSWKESSCIVQGN